MFQRFKTVIVEGRRVRHNEQTTAIPTTISNSYELHAAWEVEILYNPIQWSGIQVCGTMAYIVKPLPM